jgi:iron-sulfur cluster assembly accessory protein
MITITPAALTQLKLILMSEYGEVEGVRLSVKGGGCVGFEFDMSIVLDSSELKAADKKYDFDGVPVVIDQMSALYMESATLDYKEDLMQSAFKFDIPGSRKCGCGKSFTT